MIKIHNTYTKLFIATTNQIGYVVYIETEQTEGIVQMNRYKVEWTNKPSRVLYGKTFPEAWKRAGLTGLDLHGFVGFHCLP